ncbi:MAG: hypothetical protein ACE5EG_06935 [Thermoanaerobaculia bacterium]
MRRAAVILVSAIVAVLCLLALDDITTGGEPSHALEWTIVAATVAWFGSLFWWRRRHS